ncbi:hypothetical protein [Thioalkalivibrio sp. HK1]|uniref:hypothetical protein n=1 Tax=Thioalkalivibrio sp. HK1 TaxID=1469245 RepID=UPI0012DFC110|nr:hypothetical protein [Thioalkalivibrio sp. HK1]
MTTPPFHCSMVLDDIGHYPLQAQNLLLCLERKGAIPRSRIVVHCTQRVDEGLRLRLQNHGCKVRVIAPYLDGTYCNKLMQLDYFLHPEVQKKAIDEGLKGVFLLDLDLAVLSPLQVPDPEVIWGKPVDAPNPPLACLQSIFQSAKIDPPAIIACDTNAQPTFDTNFNGGFLYIPFALMDRVNRTWKGWAEFLFNRPELFAEYPNYRKHIDQISLAMTLVSDSLPYRHLDAHDNFPCHIPHPPRSFNPDRPIRVLHYHDRLDDFGLIAPIFSDDGGVFDTAIQQANTLFAPSDDLDAYAIYKKYLASKSIEAVPDSSDIFCESFKTHARGKNGPRRLILHAGTPKTGTSSLQWYLADHKDDLAAQGFWYPPPSENGEPKHQRLVALSMHEDEPAFIEYCEASLAQMPDHIHSIIFTTEGLYNHWRDFSPRAKSRLRALASIFDVELCVWFREPESFAASLYMQYLKNPVPPDIDAPQAKVYGRDISFEEAMNDEWFRLHLDYLGFYFEAETLFGSGSVQAFHWSEDTVKTFMQRYGIDLPYTDPPRHNTSLRKPGIDIMRIANRYRNRLPYSDQERIARIAGDIDTLIGEHGEPFEPNEQERALIDRYTARGRHSMQSIINRLPCPDKSMAYPDLDER